MKNTTLIATTLGGVVALAVGTAIVVTATVPVAQPVAVPISTPTSPARDTTHDGDGIDSLLSYVLEEEKLAHDVYVALGDAWGTTIFTNISASESQHQSQVESLLLAYDIDDPRTAQAGVFVNDELQALYDALIAQGMRSERDAMEVGVLIEQTDIRDVQHALDETDDPAVDVVLERLLNASYQHLAAFTRQL